MDGKLTSRAKFRSEWIKRRLTTSAMDVLEQIQSRAEERGLDVVDSSSILMLALWSLLLWERKVGLAALEQSGVDRFDLARDVDRLLEQQVSVHPVVYDRHRDVLVLLKTSQPYEGWDLLTLVEPLLSEAEHEARELGHNYVGTEHLLLSILSVGDSELEGLLTEHGVSYEQVKLCVIELLKG